MMASSSSPQTTTFFGFVVPLLCNPQAFPQHLVPSNLSKLCTEQDNVKQGIRHELLVMLQGHTDQVSSDISLLELGELAPVRRPTD